MGRSRSITGSVLVGRFVIMGYCRVVNGGIMQILWV